MSTFVTPATGRTSFSCPYCKALAQQQWLSMYSKYRSVNNPFDTPDRSDAAKIIAAQPDRDHKLLMQSHLDQLFAASPIIGEEKDHYSSAQFVNLHGSQCFACLKITLWLGDKVVLPQIEYVIEPNADLPHDAAADFEEAARVFPISPKASAALLRLSIQRVCEFLGKRGTIDEMIAQLVGDGLNVKIQQALDIVRVVGNESVHPGSMDVNDTPEVAEQLFKLVNLIAETMISEPKAIDALYGTLPENKRKGIEARNLKALAAPKATP